MKQKRMRKPQKRQIVKPARPITRAPLAEPSAPLVSAPAKRTLLARRFDGLEPHNLQEALALAQQLSDSQMVPKEYRGKAGDILIAIGLGHEIGLKWAQALQSIAVIGGRPCLWGDAGLGLVMQHPDYEWHEEKDDDLAERATCTMKRRGLPAPVTRSFSQADAERIVVWEKDSQGNSRQVKLADRPVWKAGYKKRMRQMRARWWCIKDTFPDAVKGIEGREYVEDDLVRDSHAGAPALRAEDVMPKQKPSEGAARVVKVPDLNLPPPVSERVVSERQALSELPSEGKAGQSPFPLTPPSAMVIEINGRQLATGGITRATLLKAYRLGAQLDELTTKGRAKELLGREYGLEHRHELTEEAGTQYIAALVKLVNKALEAQR